jgi:hypothetical protein
MRRGDFDAALRISDEVLARRDPATRDDQARPYHERWVWDGRTVFGRHVLVRCYHGLGDTIQFARFLPPLRERAASVTVECQPELMPLMATLSHVDQIVPFRHATPLPCSDCDVEIMELMHALHLAPTSVRPPYFSVRANGVAKAIARLLQGPAVRVGLCWQSGTWDEARSVPLRALAAACAAPGIAFVSLQGGPAAAEAVACGFPQLDRPALTRGILETAVTISRLDLVITVDTMVAHLAGALGRPVWLLLKADADWRWMSARTDSPWYPSIRIYRQSAAGDWREPLARIRDDLAVWRESMKRSAPSDGSEGALGDEGDRADQTE